MFFKKKIKKNNPYVIAEIGVNHECSIKMAKKLIDLAVEGGAHAAKFQTYKAEKLASKNSPAYWNIKKEKTLSQYKLFKNRFRKMKHARGADIFRSYCFFNEFSLLNH